LITSSSNKLETLASTLNSKRKASVKFLDENSIQQKALFFIPCINCNNLIHLDEIERHSNLCTKVKEDVIKAESSNYSFHVIDYKLKKLKENLSRIQNSNDSEYEKDRHLYEIINKYIGDVLALSTIHLNTLNLIKKIVSNLNVLISTFKGCLSTLIIIERARVIILEKLNILKEDLKKLHENKKDNKERKSGLINMSKFKELEMKKEGILKESSNINMEKDLAQRKISNLKNALDNSPNNSHIVDNQSMISMYINKIGNENNIKENDFNYKLDAINSDFEKSKILGEISDCTSIASNSVISDNEMSCSTLERKTESSNQNTSKINVHNNVKDQKTLYREFVKVFLKVKFEQLHNDHKGQKVLQSDVWKEAIKRNISQNNWSDFIFEELKNSKKYEKSTKKVRMTESLNKMDTIKEEI